MPSLLTILAIALGHSINASQYLPTIEAAAFQTLDDLVLAFQVAEAGPIVRYQH